MTFEITFMEPRLIRTLSIPESVDPTEALQWLCAAIREEPGRLEWHWIRLKTALAHHGPGAVYGALGDLRQALGDDGRTLRDQARTLCLQRTDLDQDLVGQTLFLMRDAMPDPVERNMMFPLGMPRPKRKKPSDAVPSTDDTDRATPISDAPLDEARVAIEYGQIDVALDILESAVLGGSDDEAIHSELAMLYRITHDLERCRKTARRVTCPKTSAIWKETLETLEALVASTSQTD